MKFYVTGRSNNYAQVAEGFEYVKSRGHEVTFEWTTLPMAKPYEQNQALASRYAEQGIQGVVDADVYIVFSSPDGNGVYTEFGAALATNTIKGSPRLFAVGPNKSAAMFNYHPSVEWKSSIEEVFATLGV